MKKANTQKRNSEKSKNNEKQNRRKLQIPIINILREIEKNCSCIIKWVNFIAYKLYLSKGLLKKTYKWVMIKIKLQKNKRN